MIDYRRLGRHLPRLRSREPNDDVYLILLEESPTLRQTFAATP